SIQAEASVMDVNRQAWNASTGLLVHPADVYVGLRSARTFVEAGKPLKLDAILTTVEGKALAGQSITLEATRHDLDFENGEYVQKTVPVAQTTLQSAAEPVGWTIDTKEGGTYQVRATVTDAKGRKNQSQMTLWVSGGKRPPARGVEQEKVTLIPDKKSYQPGEVAEILVQAPFSPADGLLTLRRSGILETRAFKVEGTSATLKVPIEEAYLPNLYVQVDLVGAAPRATDDGDKKASLPNRPAYATGQINLDIPPNARVLKLKATPKDDALAPGSETSVDLVLHDAAGKPVQGGEVAVVVVDESVLALTSYRVGDPLYTFYADRPEGASDYHQRASVQLINPEDLLRQQEQHTANGRKAMAPKPAGAMPPPAPMAEASAGARNGDDEGGGAPIKVRSNLDPLAVFAPDVPTDASGHATVRIKMPDNLTRYRVMAVAVAGGRQFGADEATITARLPLMVRPSAPRFLNFGDRFKLPVVLQNQTKQPMHVMVATRAANISLYDSSGKAASAVGFGVTIPAEDRVEVLFPAAAQEAGTARFQVGASGPGAADAAEFTLPVWTPATTEAFATYGQIDEGAIMQPVRPPGEVWPQFGGLEVTTSATALQELTDAMIYLQAYPFECAEQLSSRIVSVAALKDVLTAFKAQGLPTAQEMIAVMKRDITRLAAMQNPDGGFGFWKRGESSWPYVSVHVAHALVRAKAKGFEVPQATLERSKAYLRAVEQHIPRWYGHEARRAIIAYALNVRHRMGDNDGARARKLIADGGKEKLSMEAVGWLLPVLHADPASKTELALVLAMVNNRVTETAAAANFVSGYQDGNYLLLWSSHRVDSIMLDSLIEVQPKSDLIPKVVRGLLAHRVKGRWSNTQENAFVLLALDRYFNTYEKVTPNFVARVWLGERFAGEHPFKGRTVDEARIDVPMGWLVEHPGKPDLVLAKDGPGRLYYRIGMQYAPKDLDPPPADHGFTVLRTYEGVDDAKDARKDENGTWHFKAGAKVRVRVTMVAPSRRYHVALVDPLPAGLEAMNPALAVTGSIPQDPNQRASGRWWWWYGTWYEHQNLRDERAEAFASLLWDGVHEYTYLTRATTPGTFVAPPAKAEEMYHPETFGRSAGDRVIVE
ncbi:MAG: hypothetical protein FJX76_14455, partial [Armatimonadetes bacterium]|nr:hypothetical protein [Armatimonadota bacterium]